jgi:general secretion pathway protein A
MLRRNRQVPMYLNHYQLKLMPFEIGPDPKFLWLGSKHKEAFAMLQYGILESKGFIVIIGEPGTGKSTLLNATAANFGSNIRCQNHRPRSGRDGFFQLCRRCV